MDNIAGKTIAVTGGARGIGLAIGTALLARGARVVIGDRDVGALESTVKTLAGRSTVGSVTGHPLDVTDRESFAAFLDQARAETGHIDVLVNNAGVMPIGAFLELSPQAIRSAIEVNFVGVINGCQLVLPEMAERGSGQIVNIASVAGMVAVPGQAVYAGTKFAVVGLSTALADEFADRGVIVSAVLPTFTETELISGTTKTSAQRRVQPEDVAAAVVRIIDKPKTQVSVPGSLRFIAIATMLLPARARRWLGRKTGTDRVFLDFDAAAHRQYADRAQSSTGLTEPDN